MFGRNALFTFAVLHTLVLSTTALAPQISNNQGDNAATAPPASDQHGKDPAAGIHVISLERDATPLRVKGSVVAFRIAYTGIIRVGSPAQEFKVIFDSGSGQVVLPSNRCEGPICRRLRRYTMSSSTGAFHVELSGQPTPEDGRPDNVEISFGVGHVKGELVRDKFCLGEAVQGGVYPELQSPDTCVRVNGVMATTLSQAPFGLFNFDGIVGLGLPELSLSEDCSFFGSLFKSGVLRARQFGVYLAEGGEGSEIAFGGPNPEKLASPVMWTSVVMPGHGHWQVEIVAFHVGNYTLDVCRSGGCRGVLDTGTSHIAIPSPHEVDVESMLRRDSDGIEDCRYIENPPVVIELRGINLTIYPEDYMRQLPLPKDIKLGAKPSPAPAPAPPAEQVPEVPGGTLPPGGAPGGAQAPGVPEHSAEGKEVAQSAREPEHTGRQCVPRVVGVTLPEPVGPTTFILGQPIFHRYYTVFNFEGPMVGFGLAAPRMLEQEHTSTPRHDETVLM